MAIYEESNMITHGKPQRALVMERASETHLRIRAFRRSTSTGKVNGTITFVMTPAELANLFNQALGEPIRHE